MDIEQVKLLIAQKESDTIEFKKSTAKLHSAFETVCAFLNNHGGTVLIGITDQGDVIGQEISDHTKQEIAHEIKKLEPAAHIHIEVDYVPVNNNKYVIAIQTTSNGHIPYTYDGRPFYRNQNTTMRMSQHQYEQLLVKRGQLNHSWEELPAEGCDIDLLDHDEIRRTIQEGVRFNRIPSESITDTIQDALIRLKLLKNGQLNNAAIVLYAKNVFPQYAQCMLKMGRFMGISALGDFMDNQQVYGNIFKLLSEADNFIRRHLPIASFFRPDQFERIDKPILPMLAIREAMVNAVCHRDYSSRSSSLTLAIYDDHLEIWNNGTLPSELKLDDLKKKHGSFPRNKLIANVLYSRQFFEKWGSGTNKMIDLCRVDEIPEPVFEEYSGGLSIQFKFKESIGMVHVTQRDEKLFALTLRQEQILKILTQKEKLPLRDIAKLLENPPSLRTIGDDLSHLKQCGLVDSVGVGRGAKWLIKPKMGR